MNGLFERFGGLLPLAVESPYGSHLRQSPCAAVIKLHIISAQAARPLFLTARDRLIQEHVLLLSEEDAQFF